MPTCSLSALPVGAGSFELAGVRWVRINVAAARWGVTTDTVREWMKFGCVALGLRRISSIRRRVSVCDGEHASSCLFLRQRDVDDIAERLTELKLNGEENEGKLTIREAASRCRVSSATILRWGKNGCPALGGKPLKITPQRRANGGTTGARPSRFVDAEQVRLICGAFGGRLREIDHPRGHLVDTKTARERYGFGSNSLEWFRKHGCFALGGEKLFGVKIPRSGGGARLRWFWLEDQLRRLRQALNQDTKAVEVAGKKYILVRVAAERCNVTTTTMYAWMNQGCPRLKGGRVVKSRKERIAIPAAVCARATRLLDFVLEDDIDEVCSTPRASLREFDHPLGHVVSHTEASERFPFGRASLRNWRLKGCPALGGKTLTPIRQGAQYFYLQSELEEIQRRQADDLRNANSDLLTIREAAAKLHVPDATLRTWQGAGCRWLSGKKLPVVHLPGQAAKAAGGGVRYLTRVFVKRDVVDAILAARNGNGASEASAILDAAHKPGQTASDAGNGSPSGTQGNGERAAEQREATAQGRPSARGRKIETDVDEDRRTFEAWQTGCYPTKKDLARELGKTASDVRAAIDRHRHRAGCQTLALEKLP